MAFPPEAVDPLLQPSDDGSDLWAFAELFVNDWSGGVSLSRSYTTNISGARSAAEQRYSLFDSPLLSMEAAVLAGGRNYEPNWTSAREVSSIRALAQRMTKARGLCPLYCDPLEVASSSDMGENTLTVSDPSLARVSIGTYLVILVSGHTGRKETNYFAHNSVFEVVQVQDISGNDLTLASNLSVDVPAGSYVFPLFESRTLLDVAGSVITDSLLELRVNAAEQPGDRQLSATSVANTTPSGFSTGLFGLPVYEPLVSAADQWSWGFSRRGEASTSGISYEIETYGTRGLFNTIFSVRHDSRAAAFQTIRFFDSRRGKAFPFWLLSPLTDFYGWSGVTSGTGILLKSGGVKSDLDLVPYLYIKKKTGDILFCDVTSYSFVSDDLFLVQFEDLGESPTADEIEKVGIALLSRFDTDTLKEEWISSERMACSLPVTELENEKNITIGNLTDIETADLLVQWTAGSCYAEEDPIPEGVYAGPEFSNPINPEFWRYVPETEEWEDLSDLIETGHPDIDVFCRAVSPSNYDDKAIYVFGNVKRAGRMGDLCEVLRYSSSGMQLVGKNGDTFSENPYSEVSPGFVSDVCVFNGILHVAQTCVVGEPAAFVNRIRIWQLIDGFWEVYATSAELSSGVVNGFRHDPEEEKLYLATSVGVYEITGSGFVDQSLTFSVRDILFNVTGPENWIFGLVPDGAGTTFQGGVANWLGSSSWERRGGGFFNNVANTSSSARPLVAYPEPLDIPLGPALFYNNRVYTCVKGCDFFFSGDTALVAYLGPDLDEMLPDATSHPVHGAFSGGRAWKQSQVYPSDNNENTRPLDICVYKGEMYVCGKFSRIRSASPNAEHIAVNLSASTDPDAVWTPVPDAPTSRDRISWLCAFTHDPADSLNTHDKGHLA